MGLRSRCETRHCSWRFLRWGGTALHVQGKNSTFERKINNFEKNWYFSSIDLPNWSSKTRWTTSMRTVLLARVNTTNSGVRNRNKNKYFSPDFSYFRESFWGSKNLTFQPGIRSCCSSSSPRNSWRWVRFVREFARFVSLHRLLSSLYPYSSQVRL